MSIGEEFNPFLPPMLSDPDSVLAQARAREPIFYSPLLGAWVVTRYDDIIDVLRNPTLYSSRSLWGTDRFPKEIVTFLGDDMPRGTLTDVDPPEHTRLRRILAAAFSASLVRGLEGQIRSVATELVDRLPPHGSADLLTAFALPLPLTVIMKLIGIPGEDLELCRRLCSHAEQLLVATIRGAPIHEQLRVAAAYRELPRYFRGLLAARRAAPAGDLISALTLVDAGKPTELSDDEILKLVSGLIFAGHETTAGLIANALRYLLQTPEYWRALCSDRRLVDRAVEETLRVDSPAFGMQRSLVADATLGGVPLAAGSRIYLAFWSGNRDETRYPHGEAFSLDRAEHEPQHLAFGRGIHFCLGAPLARLEARVALNELADRLPGLSLESGAAVRHRWSLSVRRLQSLVVSWGAPASTDNRT